MQQIGVQAVIKDLQQYLQGGKKIEAANLALVKANDAVAASATKSAAAQLAAHRQVASAQKGLSKAQSGGSIAGLAGGFAGGPILAGAAAVAALAAGFSKAVGSAAQFQTAMVKVDQLTNLSSADTAKLSGEVLNLSKVTPKSPGDLGAAAYAVLSSGIDDVDEAMKIVTASAKGASVGLGSTEEVARVATSAINAYGKENITAAQAIDILFAAAKAGSADATDFAGNIGRLLGIASTLGVTFDQLAATEAALTNNGLNAEQAATGLLGIMTQIISPSEQAREALKGAGTSIEEVRANIQEKGFIPALREMIGAFDGNVDAIAALFPEVRGLGAALLGFANGGEKTNAILLQIQNSAGVTDAAFKATSKTFKFQADVLKNQLSVAFIQFGSQVLPTLTSAMTVLIKLAPMIGQAFKGIATAMIGPFNAAAGVILGVRDTVQDTVKFVRAIIDGDWKQAWQSAKDIVVDIFKTFGAFIVATMGFAVSAMLSILESGLNKAKGPLNALIGGVNKLTPGAVGDIGKVGNVDLNLDFSGKISELLGLKELEQDAGQAGDKLGKIDLNKLSRSVGGLDDSAARAKETIDALKDGVISFDEAAKLGITGFQAGALEGLNAVREAQRNGGQAAFEYAKTIAKVSVAFQASQKVGQKLILDLARDSLSKSQSAASALFARPTREMVELELEINRVTAAHRQLRAGIQDQISALERGAAAAEKNAQAIQDAAAKLSEAIQEKIKGIKDGLDKVKSAFDKEEENADRAAKARERQADDSVQSLQDRIDALQEQKSNIDPGDTPGGKAAAERQKAAIDSEIKGIEDRIKGIKRGGDQANRDDEDAHQQRQDALDLKEAQAQKEIELQEAELKRVEEKAKADALREELAAQGYRSEAERRKGQLEQLTIEEDRLKNRLQLYQDENERLKLTIQLADHTLLSQFEVNRAATILAGQIDVASANVVALANALGIDVLPEMAAADTAFGTLQGAINFTANNTFTKLLIPAVTWAALQLANLGNTAKNEVNKWLAISQALLTADQIARDAGGGANQGNPSFGRAYGGIVTRQENTTLAEFNRPEAVLPLTNLMRSREILASLPPSTVAAMMPAGAGVPGINVSVNGPLVRELEAMTHAAVSRAFLQAQTTAVRGGAVLPNGLG